MFPSYLEKNIARTSITRNLVNSNKFSFPLGVQDIEVQLSKHMKRAATHLFKRQSKNRAFLKLSNF